MTKSKHYDSLKIIGIILIILGALMMIYAFPIQSFSIVSIESSVGSIQATDIPSLNITRLIVGLVIAVFGLILYFSRQFLKLLNKKK